MSFFEQKQNKTLKLNSCNKLKYFKYDIHIKKKEEAILVLF